MAPHFLLAGFSCSEYHLLASEENDCDCVKRTCTLNLDLKFVRNLHFATTCGIIVLNLNLLPYYCGRFPADIGKDLRNLNFPENLHLGPSWGTITYEVKRSQLNGETDET